jgi:hypothetical protein
MDIQDHSPSSSADPSLQELANIMELNFDENDPVIAQSQHEENDFFDADVEHHHATTLQIEESDDACFHDEFDPEKNRTIVSLQNSGFAKAAVVVGGSFAIITGGAMMFQNQLPKSQVAQDVRAKPKDNALASAQADAAKAQQSESETKAQLALAKQKDSLAKSNDTSANPASSTGANSSGKPGNTGTTSLTPIASGASSRPVSVGGSTRSIAVVPPVASSSSSSNIQKPSTSSLARPIVAAIPMANNGRTPRQSLAASNIPSPVASKTKQSLSFHSQPTNLAASLPTTNRRTVVAPAARSPQANDSSTIAANSTAAPGTNPFSNPLRRNNGNLEAANPAKEGRDGLSPRLAPTLRDFLASNVVVPGIPSSSTTNPNTEQVQQVAIPGRGVVARNIPGNRQTMVSDKILQQMAWSLPQNFSSPTPRDVPTLAEGVQIAQGTQSLAEGIKLAQSSLAETSKEPEPSMNSGANGTRPSFYNSQVISGKSEDLKEDAIKIERLASNRNSEVTVTIDNSSRVAKGILVGTSAKGSTVTPILWNAGISSTAKFIIKLDEPIRDNTNQPAIPAGTQLVVTVKPAGTNIGFAELEVISVIIQGREFAPPVGMLVVRDEQNGLLVGEDYFKRNEQIASRDSMTVLTGALGRVGQVLTQPSSTVSSVGLGSTTVVTNQSPNILGAVLDGGFSSLPATWSQRNQQALQEIASRPNVYQIPQGRSVRIFVNQTLEF